MPEINHLSTPHAGTPHATTAPSDSRLLEQWVAMPNGGRAVRCHATSKRTGLQCNAPVTTGFTVCRSHGAGTHKRVKSGERYDPRDAGHAGADAGRLAALRRAVKPRTIVYGSSIDESIQHLAQLEDMDNSDAELAAVRAVFWKLIEHSGAEEAARLELERLQRELRESATATPEDRRSLEGLLKRVASLHRRVSHYLERVQRAGVTVVKMIDSRSTTRVRSLQVKLLEEFGRWVLLLRECLWEALHNQKEIDKFEREVRERVLQCLPMLIEFAPLEGEASNDPLEELMSGGRAELIRREVMADIAAYLEDAGSVIAVNRVDLERWWRELDSSGAT